LAKRVIAAIVVVAAVGGALALWLTRDESDEARPPATTTTLVGQATMAVRPYFYLGAGLVPTEVQAPKAPAVATAALKALLAGAPGGYQSEVPPALGLDDVTIADGVATASFARGRQLNRRAQAQIIYTLTEFPSVHSVKIVAGGDPVVLTDSAGKPVATATRDDYVDQTAEAPIFVTLPVDGASVSSPVRVAGTASTFEGYVALDVTRNGKVIDQLDITASAGAPQRGTWKEFLDLPPGSYSLVFYEPSAKDGRPLHTTTVRIHVTR
jgi:hypothetical protein